MLGGYRRLVREQSSDLPWLAVLYSGLLGIGVAAAKALVVRVAFSEATLLGRLPFYFKSLADDLLLLGVGLFLALLSRRLPAASPRLRTGVTFTIVVLANILLAAAFINAEFYGSWAATLSWELLRLAPNLAGYILLVGVSNQTGALTVWAALAIGGLLVLPLACSWLRPLAVRRGSWRSGVWAVTGVTLVLGLTLAQLPPRDPRESALRSLSLPAMFIPGWGSVREARGSAFTDDDRRRLSALCGPPSDDGARLLEPLRGRRLNVVLWVWESVGIRYLRSLHPLGTAATPNLDRMMASGSVSFSQFYTECPLTVQCTWAMLTGMSPPAKPFIFVLSDELPLHHGTLQGALRQAGYRTGAFYASYSEMWRTRRIFDITPFDVFEDAETLAQRGPYARNGIGVQDDAPVERCLDWLGTLGRDQRFFALLWNTETHRPYTWAGMPPALAGLSEFERYNAVIARGDGLLGKLYEGLAQKGLAENTVIIVLGDHGEGHRRFGRPWHATHGSQVFEDDVHIPLVFIHPKLGSGSAGALSSEVDLFPTLLDLLGLPTPAGLDGRSLARPYPVGPLLMRGASWWPLAIRAGHYKLMLPAPGGVPTLYDLDQDPREVRDRLAAEPEVARLLTSALYDWNSRRFRADPSFGYRMPGIMRLVGRAFGGPEWTASPTPTPTPSARR